MRIKAALVVCLILIVSCKKINLLSSTYIPPPTEFPNETPEYPNPTPVPTPPQEPEEKPIEVKPEVVENGTVFGGYGRRFKFKNDWYVLATNEYEYKPETKTLNPTGKGAVLRIEDDGKTITKIYSLKLGDNLEQKEYWKNLHSKKLVITDTELSIPIKAESQGWATNWRYKIPDNVPNNIGYSWKYTVDENGDKIEDIYKKITNDNFGYVEKLIIHYSNRSSSDLLNWNKYSSSNVFDFPKTNFNNPSFQGRFGNGARNRIIYFKGKIFVFRTAFHIYDEYLTYYIEPRDGYFIIGTDEYYTIEWGKDMSDAKNWVTNHINIINALYINHYGVWYNENKLYVEISSGYIKYSYSDRWKLWTNCPVANNFHKNVYTTEDGINRREEPYDIIYKYNPRGVWDSYGYSDSANDIINGTNEMLGYEMPDGTPFEPSYTELNGKYYRTFNSTYPMPPIKEIMETVDKFETNFTVTEEHIKKSGYYQLQVSSVSPDKAQESDWVNIMPNNETS